MAPRNNNIQQSLYPVEETWELCAEK